MVIAESAKNLILVRDIGINPRIPLEGVVGVVRLRGEIGTCSMSSGSATTTATSTDCR
jgi:hypothetical protein